MTVSATENAGSLRKGLWQRKATFTWYTGDGHAAQTLTLNNLIGVLENAIVSISSVTDNPTVTVTITDSNSAALLSLATLADGTVHVKKYPTDFDSTLFLGDQLTLSVDPSADPGGAAQTLTVIVILRGIAV